MQGVKLLKKQSISEPSSGETSVFIFQLINDFTTNWKKVLPSSK